MTLTYEAWRISFQSSEQAARSAYDQLAAARARIEELERVLAAERKRVSSYKLLVSSMEKQKETHLAERTKFRESLSTLDSERDANELLTKERDALLADNARLREALRTWVKCCELSPTIRTEVAIPLGALAATPAQSLARVRNQVREECANVCEEGEPTACDGYGIQLAIEIRAMMEPE